MARGRKRKVPEESSTPSASAASNEEENVWLADEMIVNRVVEDTRHNYTLSFHFLSEHCKDHIPGSCDIEGNLILPMPDAVWQKLLKNMSQPIDSVGRVRAYGTIQSYISSIKFFYQERGIDIPRLLNQNLSKWMDGYKRKIAILKVKGIMKNKEGKLPISYLQCARLCEAALFAVDTRAVSSSFVHPFMILCWNMFARSCSVTDLHYHHLSWDNDALIIDMSKQKADQAGDRITPKHVYANPWSPAICPVLALALHIFGNAFRVEGGDKEKVFLSNSSYDTFSKWLALALKSMSNLGFAPTDFGTHSFRKGIASFVAGFIGGPGIISIFLRAGWSCGPVQDRYLTYADGGDQLCGRVACGLDFNHGSKFAVLPPTFPNPASILTMQEWNFILPGYLQYPPQFRDCLPYLLASIAFHKDWLFETIDDDEGKPTAKNISSRHPFFRSRLVNAKRGDESLLSWLRDQVLPVNTEGSCAHTAMQATGIPPHIDLARQLEKLEKENQRLRTVIEQNHIQIMTEMPDLVTNRFRDVIAAPGLQHMSVPELRELLRELIRAERANYEQMVHPPVEVPTQPTGPGNRITVGAYYQWSWRGRYRPIPPNYRFPGGTVKEVCDFFMLGIPGQKIKPFRLMVCSDFMKDDEPKFSKASSLFDHICKAAVVMKLVTQKDQLYSLSVVQWDVLFKKVFELIGTMAQASKKRKIGRSEEKSYSTVFDWTKNEEYIAQFSAMIAE